MSRTATATPPPPYFPQRTATPTMRHAAAPTVTAAHFRPSVHHGAAEKRAGRRIKHLPPSLAGLKGRKDKIGQSVDGIVGRKGDEEEEEEEPGSGSSTSNSPPIDTDLSPTPSPFHSTFSPDTSTPPTSLSTPADIDASFIQQQPLSTADHVRSHPSDPHPRVAIIPSTPSSSPATTSTSPLTSAVPSASRSWVPHFALAKITKAVLPSGFSAPWSGVSLGDKKKKYAAAIALEVEIPVVWEVEARRVGDGEGVFSPEARAGMIPQAMLVGLDEEGVKAKKREWAEWHHMKLTECARLCSQWPQSGYNMSKWGPSGAKHSYEPQSYGNPNHVTEVMSRQSALETHLISTNGLYYPSIISRFSTTPRYSSSSSMTDSTTTADSFDDNSAMPSPTTTAASDHSHNIVVSEIHKAMTSPLLEYGYSAGASLVSLLLPPPVPERQSLRAAQSLSELNRLARDMMLSKSSGVNGESGLGSDGAGDKMEVDTDTETTASLASSSISFAPPPSVKIVNRPARAASCGSKRPLPPPVLPGAEEEKRRKVDDEAMVVEDAVETGVIMPPPPVFSSPALSHPSTTPPSLNTTSTPAGEVFGHIVKTSDTHPIIISPFFPTDLLPILSTHLLPPPFGSPSPLFLKSNIDVPALLLAQATGAGNLSGSGSSSSLNLSLMNFGVLGSYLGGIPSALGMGGNRPQLGNLLLSSCPGKRLRMGGPVKGRGPVCRDLKTDLGRIKAEGVGCLVCCLDDTELALLGTPWETYRDVANDLGLDIIRLPMPDGFTPVSLALFDQQVTLICSKYTLKGVNVLVHCRGGVGRAGVTACAWAIKMGFVQPHPSLVLAEENARRPSVTSDRLAQSTIATPIAPPSRSSGGGIIPFFSLSNKPHAHPAAAVSSQSPQAQVTTQPAELSPEMEHQIVMSIVERVVAMIRSRRGLKAIESFEQVQFLKVYVGWLRAGERERRGLV